MDEREVRSASDVLVHVVSSADVDAEELADLVGLLRDDLLELDVDAVERLTDVDSLPGAKSALAVVSGWLVVNLGREMLRSVAERLGAWAAKNNRTVEVTLGGDTLKVTGIAREQQDRLIDEWLERHAATP